MSCIFLRGLRQKEVPLIRAYIESVALPHTKQNKRKGAKSYFNFMIIISKAAKKSSQITNLPLMRRSRKEF